MSGTSGKLWFRFSRWFQRKNVQEHPDDVEKLFNTYSENCKRMTMDQFRKFLLEFQEDTDKDAQKFADKVFSKHEKQKKGLRLEHFFHFLLDNLNEPLNFRESEADMEAPLSDYFWHTGYDSYLYFKWHESIEAHNMEARFGDRTILDSIKKALKSGVKVIELDLMPSSDKYGIDVHYAGMTSHVPLRKCLKAIKDDAFTMSPYPVIVILVYDYAAKDLEAKVIEMIERKIGELWHPKIGLDSLKKQKNKIIILTRNRRTCSNSNKQVPSDNENEKPEVHRLIPLKKHKDGEPEDSYLNRMELCVKLSQENLIGVYLNPTGTGIPSSDYNPLIGWSEGAQMVACNMKADSIQKPEKHIDKYIEKYVWIMQGMFRANRDTGFAKKPDFLLRPNPPDFDPNKWRPVKMILKVKVYMGIGWHLQLDNQNFDPNSPPDFFAAIEIVGVPSDEAREKTLPALDRWIPKWEQEFKFPLTVPELAFVIIKVSDFDTNRTHDFGGQTCLPVSTLKRRGIRSVPLFNFRGHPHRSPVKLLVQFQLDPCCK